MPLPETTVPAPLKNMDIKTAFLAASNRKRKASPTLLKPPVKNIKLDDPSDDGVEIIMDASEATSIGDCKENTDLNTDPQHASQLKGKISPSKSSIIDIQKADNTELVKTASPNSGGDSSKESSDELNSSNLNNSVSALHTSELSESAENQQTSEKDLNSSTNQVSKDSVKEKTDTNQNDTRSKRKKRMTAEEAKARAAEREEKQKESLLKKQELEAQKLQKKLEKEKLRIQKEQEKLEREEERKEKERLKQEKKDQEEKERLQKLKEKEEGKKQRQLMLEMKQEEKKKKEEMRLKREEETKKAEEEKRKAKLEKEQKEKEKQEKAKAAFFKFFKKGGGTASPAPQVVEKEGNFKPFQVSDDMILAPVVPQAAQERFNKGKLDHVLQSQDSQELYLQILRSGCYKDVRLRKRLREQHMSDADVIIADVNEQAGLFMTTKLLQFKENLRPPYWGTWRKKSNTISGRTPFGQDAIFDYDVDSDDEWDEGGPGESLSGTENEIESEDDYEVDNEFFVPHGYLSAEEEKEEDAEENDPEKQKVRLKIKQQEFEKERKKQTVELKPKILGCYFENGPEQDFNLRTFLLAYSSEIVFDAPIPTRFTVKKLQAEQASQSVLNSPSNNSSNKKSVPEEAMPHLIRLIHGNINSRETLIKEFQVFWQQYLQAAANVEESPQPGEPMSTSKENTNPDQEATTEASASDSKNLSKRQINLTIKKISTYTKCPNPAQKRLCWWVQDEVREKYGLLDAPIPNEWSYVSAKEEVDSSPSVAKANTASIKEFLIP